MLCVHFSLHYLCICNYAKNTHTQNIPIIISYLHFLNPSFNVNKCSYIEFIIFQILGKILALCNVTIHIVLA